MKITNAEFLLTVADGDKILKNKRNEFAFVGRSNVGKSSLINGLLNRKDLAKTSKTAGLTKHINYFEVNGGAFHFVDLPGYGYHERGKSDTERWATLIDRYFKTSPNLKCVFLLLDINVDAMQSDLDMQEFLNYFSIPYILVATKTDKISKAQQNNAIQKLKKSFGVEEILLTSSNKKDGMDGILSKINQLIK